MKKLLIPLLITCLVPMAFADPAPANALTDAEKVDGWVLLFDGKDASEHFRGYKKDKLPEQWFVEEGALCRKGEGGNSGIKIKVLERLK